MSNVVSEVDGRMGHCTEFVASYKCALGIFKKGREYIGKTVGIAGEHLTGVQMAAALAKALSQSVRYNAVTPRCIVALVSLGPRIWATCFNSNVTLNRSFAERVISTSRAR
jgi:NADH dehydrogenase FAD-containing subunit